MQKIKNRIESNLIVASLALLGGLTTQAFAGDYSEITRWLGDASVEKYCFHNNALPIQNMQGAYWVPGENVYRWYDVGFWDEATGSWKQERMLESDNIEEMTVTSLTVNGPGWGTQRFWEESWVEKDGLYAIYWSAWEGPPDEEPTQRIGVATGSNASGPFTSLQHPMNLGTVYAKGGEAINPFAFKDDDGKVYLYWAMSDPDVTFEGQMGTCVYGVELNGNDLTNIIGQPVSLACPDEDWEKGGYGGADRRWNESPVMFKYGGTYYLVYSARNFNSRDYCAGYATASSPLGPFTEYDRNPFAWGLPNHSNDIWGKVGIKAIFPTTDGSQLWAVYNIPNPKYDADTPVEAKNLIGPSRGIEQVVVRADGTLAFNGSNFHWQPRPEGTIADGGRNIFKGGSLTTSGNATSINFLRDWEYAIEEEFSDYDWVSNKTAANTWINRGYINSKQVGVIMVYKSMHPDRYVSEVTVTVTQGNGTETVRVVDIPSQNLVGAAGIASFDPELTDVVNIRFDNFVLGTGATEVGVSEIRVMGK